MGLLDPSRHVDYLIAFSIGFAPIVCSYFVNAAESIPAADSGNGEVYQGYLASPNWWSLALLLPCLLYILRWAMGKIASVHAPWRPERVPPVVKLLDGEEAESAAYASLRRRLLSRKNLWAALLIVTVITILDSWPIAVPFFICEMAPRTDWASMFQSGADTACSGVEGKVSKTGNVVLVLFAYNAQAAITFLGIIMVIFLFRHNLFFLGNVYQRRRASENQLDRYFKIDVKDVNRCFGFRVANEAFNTQIVCLMIGGLAMLLSRYAHSRDTSGEMTSLFSWPPQIPELHFPLAGQWLMALVWLAALAIVAMPGMVKLLPLVPRRGVEKIHHSITHYLREFFSDESWPKDRNQVDEPVTVVAARFADNSFWPTGDNRARILFFISYWIFFILLLTPTINDYSALVVSLIVFAGLAYLATLATFLVLKLSVGYIDELLVTRVVSSQETPSDDRDNYSIEKSDIGVFISYRRADTAEYARSIHQELLRHIKDDKLFRDISDIAPGEDFVDAINHSLDVVDAVIVLIGRDWLAASGESPQSRLHDPADMVRAEIATALRCGKRILPVLVDSASMPRESELPEDLQALSRINALEISNTRWDYDVSILVETIKTIHVQHA